MPKRIYITEEAADRLLNENDVSTGLAEMLDNSSTAFGDCAAFPPSDGLSFQHLMAIEGYEKCKADLPDNLSALSLEEKISELSKLTVRCQEKEENSKPELEKLCFNIVNSMFAIPNGVITFKCHLVRDVSSHERTIRAKSEDSPELEYDSVSEMSSLKNEVAKRLVINGLAMGIALEYSKLPKRSIGDVYDIDQELPGLYKIYSALNSVVLYESEPVKMTENDKHQAGMVEVKIGGPGQRTVIESWGTVFPVLLCESIRGFLELFSSHGLPRNKSRANYIIKKADNAETEYWSMIIGPGLWERLSSSIENLDMKYFPLFFTRLSEIPGDEFIDIMKDILAGTRLGKSIVSDIVDEITEEIDYEDFEDTLVMKNIQRKMIGEKYLSPEDLDTI